MSEIISSYFPISVSGRANTHPVSIKVHTLFDSTVIPEPSVWSPASIGTGRIETNINAPFHRDGDSRTTPLTCLVHIPLLPNSVLFEEPILEFTARF
jgi:hypothetical protein